MKNTMQEIASEKAFRRLAVNHLREYRKARREEDRHRVGMQYGLYIAYKSAAWRVQFDKSMREL